MKVLGWLKILRDLLCELRAFAFGSFQCKGLLLTTDFTDYHGFF